MSRSYPDTWPPQGEVFEVRDLDLSMADGPHPFYTSEKDAIEANWRAETAANPHLFNGEIVLQHEFSLAGGTVVGRAHRIPYSTLLWWRKQPAPSSGYHLFGFAVLVSSDGAIVAIRMSRTTANPGQVYCAAGSLDATDIVDGRLDLAGNMRREVAEETGLDLATATADETLFGLHDRGRIVLFRFFRFALSADAMLARIADHMARDEEQEIDGAVAIRSADPDAHAYNPMMLPILDLFFACKG